MRENGKLSNVIMWAFRFGAVHIYSHLKQDHQSQLKKIILSETPCTYEHHLLNEVSKWLWSLSTRGEPGPAGPLQSMLVQCPPAAAAWPGDGCRLGPHDRVTTAAAALQETIESAALGARSAGSLRLLCVV